MAKKKVLKENELYKVSTDMNESVANRKEDIKFLQPLPRGAAEYNAVLSEYMKDREERKRRKQSGEEDGSAVEEVDGKHEDSAVDK